MLVIPDTDINEGKKEERNEVRLVGRLCIGVAMGETCTSPRPDPQVETSSKPPESKGRPAGLAAIEVLAI